MVAKVRNPRLPVSDRPVGNEPVGALFSVWPKSYLLRKELPLSFNKGTRVIPALDTVNADTGG